MEQPSPTVTAPPPRPQPPGPTGMATMRPQSEGIKEAGYPFVALGMQMLSKALTHFGKPGPDLTKQALKILGAGVNPMGTPGPEQAMAMQDAMRTKMRSAGIGPAPAPEAPMPGAA